MSTLSSMSGELLTIFTHIPKTAGSTITSVIDSVYRPHEIARIYSHTDAPAFMEKLSPRVRFLTGHVPYGLHQYTDRPCRYFTILRDPAERVISLYYYLRRATDHPAHERIKEGHETLLDVVRHQENVQTHYLAGLHHRDPRPAAEKLALARAHLQSQYAVAGLAEQFDESLLLLQSAFAWRFGSYRSQNATRRRPALETVSEEVQSALRHHNCLDQEIYDLAQEQFGAQVAAQPAGFHERVERLRERTRRWGKVYALSESALGWAKNFSSASWPGLRGAEPVRGN